jgi:hypothetical protein
MPRPCHVSKCVNGNNKFTLLEKSFIKDCCIVLFLKLNAYFIENDLWQKIICRYQFIFLIGTISNINHKLTKNKTYSPFVVTYCR